jgi:AraC-like DNA-binding protein
MKIEDFAGLVHMSVSSFHEHFKSVTSMSPLHYRKVLRLQEARRLMLSTVMDAGNASQRVGYLSIASRDSTLGLTYSDWSTMLNTPLNRKSRCW